MLYFSLVNQKRNALRGNIYELRSSSYDLYCCFARVLYIGVEFDHRYLLKDPFPTHSLPFQMKMGEPRYVWCRVVKGWFFARSSTSHAASPVISKFSSFSVCSWRKTSGVIYLYSCYSQRNLSCTIRRRCSMSKPQNGGRWAIQSHISNGRTRCWDYGPSFCKWPICWEAQLVADLWYHQDRDICLVFPSIHSYSGSEAARIWYLNRMSVEFYISQRNIRRWVATLEVFSIKKYFELIFIRVVARFKMSDFEKVFQYSGACPRPRQINSYGVF